MKRLLYLLLFPLAALGQSPTNATTQIIGSSAFTPNGWRYKDSMQVQAYNTTLAKYFQLVTGKQFNNYIGTRTQDSLTTKATISYVNTIVASHETFYKDTTTASGANNITIPALNGKILLSVTRSGAPYYPTTNPSPTGTTYYADGTGNLKFQDAFLTGEKVSAQYKYTSGSPFNQSTTIEVASYADMVPMLTGTNTKIFYVRADEVYGGGLASTYKYDGVHLYRGIDQLIY